MKVADRLEGAGKQMPMGFFVRPMRFEDIGQVAKIEKECFPTGWIATPFKRELRNRMTAYLVACEAADRFAAEAEARAQPPEPAERRGSLFGRLIAGVKDSFGPAQAPVPDLTQRIVGFVGLWFMADEADITAIGVSERYRRNGVGELLLLSAAEVAVPRGSRVLSLEVRVSNDGAKALYEKYGFRPAGVRKGYYTDNNEDALIMTTDAIYSDAYGRLLADLKRRHAEHWGESVRLVSQAGPS